MSYNANFGLPPGQRGPYDNFPGAQAPQPLPVMQPSPDPNAIGPTNDAAAAGAMQGPPGGDAPPAGAAPGGMPAAGNPQALAAMLQLSAQSPQQANLKRAMARADALRASAPAMMQGQGGMPNYLGALASVVASRRADRMDSENAATATQMGREQRNAGMDAISALTGANRSDMGQQAAASDAVAEAMAKQKALKEGKRSIFSKMFGGADEE